MLRERRSHRYGYTLVEMLTVIAVVTILAALVTAAALPFISQARDKATQGLIRKASGLMQTRIDAFSMVDFRNKEMLVDSSTGQTYIQMAGGNKALGLILAKKGLFRNAFPQTWEECLNAGYIDATAYTALSGQMASAGHSRDNESAEVLYFVLSGAKLTGSVASTASPGVNVIGYSTSEGDAFTTSEYRDVKSGTGVSLCTDQPELIDAWGNALRFYRWPTRLLRPGGAPNGVTPPAPIMSTDIEQARSQMMVPMGNSPNTDPDDPLGLILASGLQYDAFELAFHTVSTYNAPLIISAGADEQFGLGLPWDNAPNGYRGYWARPLTAPDNNWMIDNITNHTIKSGGK